MARPKKVVTVDEKIVAAQAKVDKLQEQYDEAVAELEALKQEKAEQQDAELLEAIKSSAKSYDEVMNFLGE